MLITPGGWLSFQLCRQLSSPRPKKKHCNECYSDSGWAGCNGCRKSTSSGNMFLDGQVLYACSRAQKTDWLSSFEAEYYASASSASDAVLVKEVVEFRSHRKAQLHLLLDSTAARGVIARRGVGRIKHIQIRALFLQGLHKQGQLTVHPVGAKENTADLGTKQLSGSRVRLRMGWLGFFAEGKPVGERNNVFTWKASNLKEWSTVRRVGNFALAALLLATSFVGGEGTEVFCRKCSSVMSVCKDVMCSHVRRACRS